MFEVKGRRGRRPKQIMDELKEKRVLEISRESTSSHFLPNSL
jgi:hypothetical protein